MKSDCEILVEASALTAALSMRTDDHNWRDAHAIVIGPARTGLRITSAGMDAEIRGVGTWLRTVEVDADTLCAIGAKLGDRPIVTVIYTANRLMLNRLAIDAIELPDDGAAYRSPKKGQQWEMQFGLDKAAPRVNVCNARLRPRRPQRQPASLPLFGATRPQQPE